MNIVLVTCPCFAWTIYGPKAFPYIPLGLLTVASLAESSGHSVQVIDVNRHLDTMAHPRKRDWANAISALICDQKPDLVGFSTMCNSYSLTLRIAQAIHRWNSLTPLVLGGPQATAVNVATMEKFSFITAIVRGEAETSFQALLSWIAGEEAAFNIPGITYRTNNKIVQNPDGKLVVDLDALPKPAYHLYPIQEFERIPIEAGRGCPFECSFCSTNLFFKRRYRIKSAQRLISDMKDVIEMGGCNSFSLQHDMFTIDRRKIVEFCEIILREGLQVDWRCSARIDCVDDSLIDLMGKAGCKGMFFGIETGSERVQQAIQKKLVTGDIVPVLKYVHFRGIVPTASFIVGFPDEELGDLFDTIRVAMKLMRHGVTDVQFHLLSPLPGSPLTNTYAGQLVLQNRYSDLTWSILELEDWRLIREFPTIFSSYYSFPIKHRHTTFLWFISLVMLLLSRLLNYLISNSRGTSIIGLRHSQSSGPNFTKS